MYTAKSSRPCSRRKYWRLQCARSTNEGGNAATNRFATNSCSLSISPILYSVIIANGADNDAIVVQRHALRRRRQRRHPRRRRRQPVNDTNGIDRFFGQAGQDSFAVIGAEDRKRPRAQGGGR